MRKQKLFAGVLILALLFLQCTEPVMATGVGLEQSVSVYIDATESKLATLANSTIDGSKSQRAVFENLNKIAQYAIYFDFLYANSSVNKLNINEEELSVYAKCLNNMIIDFNTAYGKSNSSYNKLELNSGVKKFDYNTFSQYCHNTLCSDITKYLTDYLDGKKGKKESDLKKKYSTELGRLYSLLSNLQDSADTILNWCDSAELTGGISINIDKFLDGVFSNSDYSKIIKVASSSESEKSDEEISIDVSSKFIENLADVTFSEDGNLEIEENPKLSMAYLAILSASSVYTPFISYTGNSEFTSALEALGNSKESDNLLSLYNSTKGFKKPLYKRQLDVTGNPTGVAEVITLSEFLEDIETGEMGALCTVLGEFGLSDYTWAYKQGTVYNSENASQAAVLDGNSIYIPFNGETAEYDLLQFSITVNESEGEQTDNTDMDSSEDNVNFFDDGADTDPLTNVEQESSEEGVPVSKIDKLLNHFTVNAYVDAGFNTEEAKIGSSDSINTVYAYQSITNESVMSPPVLLYGTKYARSIDNLTTALLTNILKNTNWAKDIENADTRYLYINAYGDIVLDDDLVVLPGAANPLLYQENLYNPFTVAFMNSYPSVLKNTGKFRLASKADIGKYLIFGVWNSSSKSYESFLATKTTSISTVEPQGPITIPEFQTTFTSNFGTDSITIFKTRKLVFGEDDAAWDSDSEYASFYPCIINTTITIDGDSVFPYSPKNDLDKTIAKAIANDMYAYYTVDNTTNSTCNQGKLNDGYILNAFIINALNGTDNAVGYENDEQLQYETYTANATNRKYKTILDLSNNLFKSFSNLSGVVGVKSVYDNPVVGNLLTVFKENIIFFFFLVILLLLFFFNKSKLDLFQFSVFTVTSLIAAYLYVTVFPSAIPAFFNVMTNNLAQNLSYEILSVDAENYSIDKSSGSTLTKDGSVDYDSTSITLYKSQGRYKNELAESLSLESTDVVGGKIGVVNEKAGVYVKNDEICVNTNILFDTLEISGSLNDNFAYILSSRKIVSSNVDYYIPYYEIVDGLVEKINSISDIYSIPRKTSVYANGEIKNNYLLYSYVNSKPFVTPGDYEYVLPSASGDWTEEELQAYTSEGESITKQLQDTFGKNSDWLGLSKWIYNLTKAEKKTLWAQTMRDLGYYDINWNPNTEKLDDLVTYVNYHTKRFVMDNTSQIGTLSDDVMIKIVSLRALVCLTQRASDFSHWMYPFTINYEEMEIEDILRSIFIANYDRYVEMDMDVVQYIFNEYGWINLVVFDLVTILLFLVVSLLNWIIPVFYLLLGILVCVRLVIGKNIKEALKGYFKMSLILLGCSTVLTVTILGVKALNGTVIGIYLLLCVLLLIIFILITVLTCVLKNFIDFGNTELNVKIASLPHVGVNNMNNFRKHTLHTNKLVYNQQTGSKTGYGKNSTTSRYSLKTGVEDFYDTFSGMYAEDYYMDEQPRVHSRKRTKSSVADSTDVPQNSNSTATVEELESLSSLSVDDDNVLQNLQELDTEITDLNEI